MFAIQKGRSNPVRISSKRCENDKVAPVMLHDTVFARAGGEGKMPFDKLRAGPRDSRQDAALHCNAFAQFIGRKPRDTDDLISAALAGGNGNGRSRHLQKFRKEFDASLIGAPL